MVESLQQMAQSCHPVRMTAGDWLCGKAPFQKAHMQSRQLRQWYLCKMRAHTYAYRPMTNVPQGLIRSSCNVQLTAGSIGGVYSILTDNEHSLNAQFVQRGQRMNEETHQWLDMPTLGGRATVVGAVGFRFKDNTVQVQRRPTGEIIGGTCLPSALVHSAIFT